MNSKFPNDKIVQKLETVLGQNRIKQNELLTDHTILKREVTAQFYTEVDNSEELIHIVRTAQDLRLSYRVFGTGSKIIFADENTSGLVIKNNSRRFVIISRKGKIVSGKQQITETLVQADAGVNLNQLVRYTLDEGLEGLEYFLGIPGTLGGAMYNNITYPPKRLSIWSNVRAVRLLTENGEVKTYMDKIDFFRRTKFLQNNNAVLISAIFTLLPNAKQVLWERGEEALEYRNG